MISMVVGLGNVGIRYAETRHNLGFDLLSIINKKWGTRQLEERRGDYYVARKNCDWRSISLIWPTTYMNNSGVAVVQALAHSGLNVADILVVYDDFNIPLGNIRIRTQGSHGGHNGMESIITYLGTDEILRLRMGIGPIPENCDPIDFVLSRFNENEIEIRNKMLDKSVEAVLYLLKNRPEEAMTVYNVNPAPDEE